MLKIGTVVNEESSIKVLQKWVKLNFDWESIGKDFIEDYKEASLRHFLLTIKLKLEIKGEDLYLHLNPSQYKRSFLNPLLINLFNELFCDFDKVLEKHPSITHEPVLEEKELTPEETLKLLASFHHKTDNTVDVQHPDLLPELRPYQEDAVRWLLSREQNNEDFIEEGFEIIHSKLNEEFYINTLSLEIYPFKPLKCFLAPGGILADEMGLGKTVEMLALFLLHPNKNMINKSPELFTDDLPLKKKRVIRCICGKTKSKNLIECLNCGVSNHKKCVAKHSSSKSRDNYICPECWELQENLLDCSTTLIVSPNSIKNQWKSEIERHISKPLNILMYEKITNKKYMSPMDLTSFDIIIIDYSTLRSEIYYDAENFSQMNRRHESRTMKLLSPLTRINWWRICMDEAQMVSTTKTNIYKMINKLNCVNKWAVTGTPIHKSIEDLLVHVNLFKLSPFSEKHTFDRLVYEYRTNMNNTLVDYLQKIMWRMSKDEVKDQLNLPEHKEIVHFVNFTNIMTFFYDEQRQKYTEQFFLEANFVKSKLVKDIDGSRLLKVRLYLLLSNIYKSFLSFSSSLP